MVQWLIYPTELGRPPDEIEPVGVQPMRHPEGVAPAAPPPWRPFRRRRT